VVGAKANWNWKTLGVLLLAVILLLIQGAVLPMAAEELPSSAVASDRDDSQILKLTAEVLRKEIDLERFSLTYRVRGSAEPRWRRLRYFLGQQAAAGLELGSDTTLFAELGKHLKTPEEASERVLRAGTRVGLIGFILDGGSSAFELGSNALLALKNKREGVDPETAKRTVFAKLKEIDALCSQRQALVLSSQDSKAKTIHTVEGKLLRHFRDWCLYEFAEAYADVRSYQPGINVFYALDTASGALSSVSYLLSLRAFKHPAAAGPAGIVGIVGDAVGIVQAPASSLAKRHFHKFWRKRLSMQFHEQIYNAEDSCKAEMAELGRLVASVDDDMLASVGAVKERVKAYGVWAERSDQYISKQQVELRRLDKVALQSEIAGPLISGTVLAQDVLATAAAYGARNKPRREIALQFAGPIASGTGASASLLLTGYWYVGDQLNERRLKRLDELPSSLLQQRLKTLNDLEKQVLGR